MYYRINVSKYEQHFFCTGETIVTEYHMLNVISELNKVFNSDNGYDISVTLRYTRADEINVTICPDDQCGQSMIDNVCTNCK